jgi:hypothetical protein
MMELSRREAKGFFVGNPTKILEEVAFFGSIWYTVPYFSEKVG